jgi:hypothetical protein
MCLATFRHSLHLVYVSKILAPSLDLGLLIQSVHLVATMDEAEYTIQSLVSVSLVEVVGARTGLCAEPC